MHKASNNTSLIIKFSCKNILSLTLKFSKSSKLKKYNLIFTSKYYIGRVIIPLYKQRLNSFRNVRKILTPYFILTLIYP